MDISKIQLENDIYNIKDETARTLIESINQRLNNIEKPKKYIFVGDSYGDGYTPDGNVTSWITLLADLLNLESSDYISVHKGGASFGGANNFIDLVRNLKNDENVTDIIVGGSYNDLNSNESNIKNGILNFKTLVNQKFPNAKIHIAFIGWSKNGTAIDKLSNTYHYYKNTCIENDVNFLEGVYCSLHNYFVVFSSDGIHPNEKGQDIIAHSIHTALTQNIVNIYNSKPVYFDPIAGASASGFEWITILHDGCVDFISRANAFLNFASSNYPTVGGSLSNFTEIGTLNSSLAVGGSKRNFVANGVPCVINTTDNKYFEMTFNILFVDGKIYLQSPQINEAHTNYQTYQIKQIQISCFATSISALYC